MSLQKSPDGVRRSLKAAVQLVPKTTAIEATRRGRIIERCLLLSAFGIPKQLDEVKGLAGSLFSAVCNAAPRCSRSRSATGKRVPRLGLRLKQPFLGRSALEVQVEFGRGARGELLDVDLVVVKLGARF